ncbi:hypothetical protein VTK56DRAFT_7415 [Thermocarpiscus australiensis]
MYLRTPIRIRYEWSRMTSPSVEYHHYPCSRRSLTGSSTATLRGVAKTWPAFAHFSRHRQRSGPSSDEAGDTLTGRLRTLVLDGREICQRQRMAGCRDSCWGVRTLSSVEGRVLVGPWQLFQVEPDPLTVELRVTNTLRRALGWQPLQAWPLNSPSFDPLSQNMDTATESTPSRRQSLLWSQSWTLGAGKFQGRTGKAGDSSSVFVSSASQPQPPIFAMSSAPARLTNPTGVYYVFCNHTRYSLAACCRDSD